MYKTDSIGVEQWRQEYNYGVSDSAWALCKTNDDEYLLTGWADNAEKLSDFWMIKTDSTGNKIWEKTHGGSKADFGHARNCYQTSDNGYIMSDYTYSFGAGGIDAWIVKTDSMGTMEWNKTYGLKATDSCWSFESAEEDTYVFCMTVNLAGASGDKDDIHLVETDSDGHIIWIQEYGGEGRQVGQHICKTPDGGFIVAGRNGRYFNDDSDGILVKFTSFSNERPDQPKTPSGPSKGKPDNEYTFSTSCSDPDGDILQYKWDWGDGNFSDWLETTEANYTWTTENNFEIKVMAKDEHDGESDWSDPFIFNTPKIKSENILLHLYKMIIERFPIFEKILNQII